MAEMPLEMVPDTVPGFRPNSMRPRAAPTSYTRLSLVGKPVLSSRRWLIQSRLPRVTK